MIDTELKHLAQLLNDMQSLSNVLPETATDFDVVLLLCDLVTLLRYQITHKICLEVTASRAFWVHLPENTLRQVMLNLVLNSLAAVSCKRAGCISITVSKPKSGLVIQVFDNGTGFSKDLLHGGVCVLSSNQPTESETGLVITERFVKNMGGSIKFSNHFPHGACVTLLLPESCLVKNLTVF